MLDQLVLTYILPKLIYQIHLSPLLQGFRFQTPLMKHLELLEYIHFALWYFGQDYCCADLPEYGDVSGCYPARYCCQLVNVMQTIVRVDGDVAISASAAPAKGEIRALIYVS